MVTDTLAESLRREMLWIFASLIGISQVDFLGAACSPHALIGSRSFMCLEHAKHPLPDPFSTGRDYAFLCHCTIRDFKIRELDEVEQSSACGPEEIFHLKDWVSV